MEKKETTATKVIDFLGKFSGSTVDVICTGVSVNNKLTMMKVLKGLVTDGKVLANKDSDPPVYSLVSKVAPAKKENDEVRLKIEGGRDTSKLKFQGKEYGKGPLVLAVVKAFVEKNPKISIEKLKEVFPDSLQTRYGMIQPIATATKLSKQSGRDRHFLKPEQIIIIGRDKKKCAVSNQWSGLNIAEFLAIAKKLRYNIT